MKRPVKNFLLILLGFAPLSLMAQVSTGLLFGISTGAVKLENIDDQFSEVIKGEKIRGYEGGVFLKLKGGPFYVKPAVLYNFRKGDVNFRTIENEKDPLETTAFKQHKIQLPLNFGFNILGPLAIEGGPMYNYMFSVTDEFGGKEVEIGQTGLGYRIGASLELGNAFLTLSYEGARFKSDNDNNPILNEPYKLIFGLGIAIGGKDK